MCGAGSNLEGGVCDSGGGGGLRRKSDSKSQVLLSEMVDSVCDELKVREYWVVVGFLMLLSALKGGEKKEEWLL